MSAIETTLTPTHRHTAGRPRAVTAARLSIDADRTLRIASYARALADPIRVHLVEVLAEHPGELCAGELLPRFDVAASTLSHHLKTLADVGILESRREGQFAYYLVRAQALADLAAWLDQFVGAGVGTT